MRLRHLFCTLATLLMLAATARAEPLPIEAISTAAMLRQPLLSPSGERFAVVFSQNGVETVLVRSNADGRFVPAYRSEAPDFSVRWMSWLDEQRLLISLDYGGSDYAGMRLAQSGLVIVGAGGEGQLINLYNGKGLGVNWSNHRAELVDQPRRDPDSPLLQAVESRQANKHLGVVQLDTRTAFRSRAAAPVEGAIRFWADAAGLVRVVLRAQGEFNEMLHRPDADSAWSLVQRIAPRQPMAWQLLGFGDAPQHFYIRAAHEGRAAILRLDLARPEAAPELVSAADGVAQAHSLLRHRDSGAVLGVWTDGAPVLWGDGLPALLGGLQAALPGSELRLLQWQGGRYLLQSSRHDQPPRFWVGDRASAGLSPLLAALPGLPEQLPIALQRQDLGGGRQLRIYRPLGAKAPLPLVWCSPCELSRGERGAAFNPLIAWLLGQGWAVAEPLGFRTDPQLGYIASARELAKRQLQALDGLLASGGFERSQLVLLSSYFEAYSLLLEDQPQRFAAAYALGVPSEPGLLANRAIESIWSPTTRRSAQRNFDEYSAAELMAATLGERAAALPARMLLVHPARDPYVDIEHSRSLAKALRARGSGSVELLELADSTQPRRHGPQRAELLKALQRLLTPAPAGAQAPR